MCMALAALRLGFLSRQIRNYEELPNITPILRQADRALYGLSNRMNGYQRSTVAELWERLSRSHSLARRYLLEQNAAGSVPTPLKLQHDEIWRDLRVMLSAVISGEPRLMAWFDIGDHLADISSELYEGRVDPPLSAQQWDYIYSGVDSLSSRERRLIDPFYPIGYNDGLHLACQLIGAFTGLCGLLEYMGDDITAVPKWDGTTISYCGRQKAIRHQVNSIIIPILDAFERLGWPDSIMVPPDLAGDTKQAIYHFNKLRIIRLSLHGDRLRW